MTPKRKQRLIIILALVFGSSLTIGLTLFALDENINLFYSASQIASGDAPKNTRIRFGGMVVKGSIERTTDSLEVAFKLTDYASEIKVVFTGILPDLFREEQGIMAEGKLDKNGVFQADEVLAKHDENYMSPEIAESMKKKTEVIQ
jgi:cytochrome c-type biogenesis protein CcmE